MANNRNELYITFMGKTYHILKNNDKTRLDDSVGYMGHHFIWLNVQIIC